MNYILAVSGGVDSVVLLDIMARKNAKSDQGTTRLIVAHVDHGIRSESGDDRRFVEGLARQYGVLFLTTELGLGQSASEEQARQARYDFLLKTAQQHQATVMTAHHQDDVLGSIAINILRGTAWRGLAVMNRAGIERPLIGWTKQTIYQYAIKHRLEWVEDASNATDKYLRNRLRKSVLALPGQTRSQLIGLRASQLQLAHDIDHEIRRVLELFAGSRYRYGAVDPIVATELLRAKLSITRPQAELALLAIKTARPGSTHVVDGRLKLSFTATEFAVEN